MLSSEYEFFELPFTFPLKSEAAGFLPAALIV
jgi:hypothetical protein